MCHRCRFNVSFHVAYVVRPLADIDVILSNNVRRRRQSMADKKKKDRDSSSSRVVCDPRTDFWCRLPESEEDVTSDEVFTSEDHVPTTRPGVYVIDERVQ